MSPRLILGSKSPARRMVLEQAQIPFQAIASDVDEDAIKAKYDLSSGTLDEFAMQLAEAKALAVSSDYPHAYVIGSDQILGLDGEGFDKPTSLEEAAERLSIFSGKTHHLHNAVCIALGGEIVWRTTSTPALTMRNLTRSEIEQYIDEAGGKILSSVGAYQLENTGVRLFENISGEYFAILGMPLLEMLGFLREKDLITY